MIGSLRAMLWPLLTFIYNVSCSFAIIIEFQLALGGTMPKFLTLVTLYLTHVSVLRFTFCNMSDVFQAIVYHASKSLPKQASTDWKGTRLIKLE